MMNQSRKLGLAITPIIILVAVLAIAIYLIKGGSPSDQTLTTNQPDHSKPKIALIMKSLANEFFVTMQKGAEAYHQNHAEQFDLISNGIKDENDLAQQVALVEQMIAQGVDALVIAPADSKALIPVCKKAQKKGIVVINIDNKFDSGILQSEGLSVPFVGPDNRDGARRVGEVLAQHLQAGDEVAIIEGVPTAFNAKQRRLGFQDAMDAAGMTVVSTQSGYWEQAKANMVAAAMINEFPNLKALLCSNDNMALGAVAAIKAAGKQGQIAVVGFDNISAIQAMLQDQSVLATADQYADQLAVFGIEYALEVLSTQSTPADKQTQVDVKVSQGLMN